MFALVAIVAIVAIVVLISLVIGRSGSVSSANNMNHDVLVVDQNGNVVGQGSIVSGAREMLKGGFRINSERDLVQS